MVFWDPPYSSFSRYLLAFKQDREHLWSAPYIPQALLDTLDTRIDTQWVFLTVLPRNELVSPFAHEVTEPGVFKQLRSD